MKSQFLIVAIASVWLSGCADVPPAPPSVPLPQSAQSASNFQRVSPSNDFISVQGGYSVLIKKMDGGDPALKDLSDVGLPITVVFVNRSGTPITFGPDEVQVMDEGGNALHILTKDDIQQIEDDQKSGFFDTLMAVAGAAAVSMDAAQLAGGGMISATQAAEVSNFMTSAAVAQLQDNDASNAKIDAQEANMIQVYQGVVLTDSEVASNGHSGGVILVRGADPSSHLSLLVKTGGATHVFRYGAPPAQTADAIPPAAAQSGGAASASDAKSEAPKGD